MECRRQYKLAQMLAFSLQPATTTAAPTTTTTTSASTSTEQDSTRNGSFFPVACDLSLFEFGLTQTHCVKAPTRHVLNPSNALEIPATETATTATEAAGYNRHFHLVLEHCTRRADGQPLNVTPSAGVALHSTWVFEPTGVLRLSLPPPARCIDDNGEIPTISGSSFEASSSAVVGMCTVSYTHLTLPTNREV